MSRCFLLIIALLLMPAVVCAPAWGEARKEASAPLQYRRILAPADRMADWPTGEGKYLPLEVKEFERLLAALKTSGDSAPASPSAQLRRAEYHGVLETASLLTGKAELEISLTTEPRVFLPLDPCNLSLRNPRWKSDSADSPNGSEENKAVWGTNPQGKLGVVAQKGGKLLFDWALAGKSDASGNLVISGEIPSASASSLLLDLPDNLRPQIEEGAVLESQSLENSPSEITKRVLKRWRIELGGNRRFLLKLVPNAQQETARGLPLLHEARAYDISLRGVDISAQWKIQNRGESLEQIGVLLDPEVELVAAHCEEGAATWTRETLPDGQGERAIVRLPPSPSKTSRILRMSAIAPLNLDRLGRLPRLRPEGVIWEDGTIGIAAVRPLSIERLRPVDCSQTATSPLAAPRIGESAQFRSLNSEATVEVALALHREEVTAAVATVVEIGSGEISARLLGDFRSAESSQFVLEAAVTPAWRIDEVTSLPAEAIADWNLELKTDGNRRLVIRLAKSIGPEQPVRVMVAARRLRKPSERSLKFADFQPLHYLPPVESKGWLSLKAVSGNELKIEGNDPPRRVSLKDLPSAERELLSGAAGELLFSTEEATDTEVVIKSRKPEYSAAICMEVEPANGRLQESWKIRCVPGISQVEKILVKLSEKSEVPPQWKVSGTAGLAITARPSPKGESADSASSENGEVWEITLSRPQIEPFELHGSGETIFQKSQPLALASLPEASRQTGTLVVRRTPRSGVRIENRRLKSLPPEPPSIEPSSTAWATFSYDPSRDATYSKQPSISIAPADRPLSSACAWSALLDSWHDPEGISCYTAVWELQLGDREQVQIALPGGVDPGQVTGIWLDGQAASWQPLLEINTAVGIASSSRIVISLPATKRFVTLAVEFAVKDKSLGSIGTIASRLPSIDLPVLSAGWRMWLPKGYEAVAGQTPGSPLYAPGRTLGKCLWGPLGRPADEHRFRLFSSEDWAAIAGDPASRHARRNLEKVVQVLSQAIDNPPPGRKNSPLLWRDIFESSIESLNPPRLLVDRLALDRLGISGHTPLPAVVIADASRHVAELLRKNRLVLLVSGDSILLTSQIAAALYSRQWSSLNSSVAGVLSRGPLADRLTEALRKESEGRYLPARVWAQLPPKPKSPWDRTGFAGTKAAAVHGWNAARGELSLQEATSVKYIHRPAFRIAGSAVFFVVVALGWWFLLRRWLVLWCMAAGFGLAALLLADPFAALSSWAMLGTLFCMVLPLVIRKRAARETETAKMPSSPNMPPLPMLLESTVYQAEGLLNGESDGSSDSSNGSKGIDAAKLLLMATMFTSVSLLSADELANTEAAPLPASQAHRVFVPTDAANKPVGDKVYVPESFYNELYRRAGIVSEEPQGWLLTSAVYRGSLKRESATGQFAIEMLSAQIDFHTFGRAVRMRIPFDRENANLAVENVLLDGRPLRIQWEAEGSEIVFHVDEPGDYRLELPLHPTVRIANGRAGFEVSIPRLAGSRLELLLPSDPPAVEVPSALGKVAQISEPSRILADLGPSDRLSVAWRESAAGAIVAEIDQLLWLKVQPGSAVLDVRLRGNAAAGRIQKLQLAADPRLRLQPFFGPDAPRVQTERLSDGPQIITLEWREPLPEQGAVGISFLLTGSSGVGHLRLPAVEVQRFPTGKRWLGVSVDPQLEHVASRPSGESTAMKTEVEPTAVNEFLKMWGNAASAPLAAYRLGAAADWSLATRPREPIITAEPTLALSFDRGRVEMDFAAQLNGVLGYVFQYRLLAPKRLSVQTVSLQKDGVELVRRWTHEADGAITVFLTGPAEGRQELKLRGTMLISGQSSLPLPALRIEQVGSESMLVGIYRRPGVLVEVTPPEGATLPTLSDAGGMKLGDISPSQAMLQDAVMADVAFDSIMSENFLPATEHEIGQSHDLTDRGRLVRAYRVSGNSASMGEVVLKPNKPVFKAKQLLWLRQEDRQWRAGIDYRIQVVEGVVDQFEFDISPSWIGPYTISTDATISTADIPGERRRMTIVPAKAIDGEYALRVSGPLKFEPGERPIMPQIVMRQAQELLRIVALPRKLQGQETNWEIGGLNIVPLPEVFADSIDAKLFDICEATNANPQAVLRQQEQVDASPRIGLADIQVAWQSNGTWRGVATFDLTPGGMSMCPLRIPQGCDLILATVDGQPVQPQATKPGEWRLNLNSDCLPQRVAVVYCGRIEAADRPGTHGFAAATLGEMPVAQTLWTVAGPSRFTVGECGEIDPINPMKQQWMRFRRISEMIEQSAGLLSEDNDQTRRWYQLNIRYWVAARTAVRREWLPISQTAAGKSMQKEMESLEGRQSQFAERLEMSDVLRQLLAASPQALEPAQWWDMTLFDPTAAAGFEQKGRLASLQLKYGWTEKSQTIDQIWYILGILGILSLAIRGIRKNYWERLNRSVPWLGYPAGGALGLIWWLWLSPSWLGWGIILVSAASWAWSWRRLRRASPYIR